MAKLRARETSRPSEALDDDTYAAAAWRKVCAPGYGIEEFAPGSDRVAANRLRRLVGYGGDVPSTVGATLQPGWRDTLAEEGLNDG